MSKPSSRAAVDLWLFVWPAACIALFVAGVLDLLPNGAMLVLGPFLFLLWGLAVRARLARRD
jgi:hypothetical protein